MEAQSLSSHQHSWWFSCFSLREKLARSHKKKSPFGLFRSVAYKRALSSAAKYSKPGLPRRANMFFL